MADVFLSYKREDAAKVRKLVSALREQGLEVWWDEDIAPSSPWEETIERALADAKAVVVCWSADAVASENVRSEARRAREDGRLIQVFVKPCEPPLFFGERQGLDLTSWRGRADDPRIARLIQSIRDIGTGRGPDVAPGLILRRRLSIPVIAAIAALLLILGSAVGWWWLTPARAEGPATLAVLPFRTLNAADTNLVDAIWDDTRGALSRNPNLRVLGRQAVEKLAKEGLAPADYRRKVHADYLLDGSVQRVANQVQMKLSLVRTQDGTEVWSDQIGGKLDDVFAFQTQIANEVEGRIRGRVAPGGGVTSKNIATTGEVYALFAEARAKVRHRDSQSMREGIAILKQALALDPNYAPAWAELGVATGLGVNRRPDVPVDKQEAEAVSYLKRSLQLAPNLAYAHAGLAMVQNFPPELEGELRKAVALNPNDAEVWSWLGNFYWLQNRQEEALVARTRAAEIEPLWINTIANRLSSLVLLKDRKGVAEELARVAATGDPVLSMKARWMVAINENKPAEGIRILLQLRSTNPEEATWADSRISGPLLQLGFIDEAMRALHLPQGSGSVYSGSPEPASVLRTRYQRPVDFWLDNDAPGLYGRLLLKHGRLSEYLGYYKAAFKSADDLSELLKHRPGVFTAVVPTTASVLRQGHQDADADELIQKAEPRVALWLANGPALPDLLSLAAQYRALDGKNDEAVALLGRAVADGWLPDRSFYATDIADEPCFAHLVDRADFQAVRKKIFTRIEEERRKVPYAVLAQAYPAKMRAAA